MSGLTNSFKLAIAQNENLVSTSPKDENRKLILRTNTAHKMEVRCIRYQETWHSQAMFESIVKLV